MHAIEPCCEIPRYMCAGQSTSSITGASNEDSSISTESTHHNGCRASRRSCASLSPGSGYFKPSDSSCGKQDPGSVWLVVRSAAWRAILIAEEAESKELQMVHNKMVMLLNLQYPAEEYGKRSQYHIVRPPQWLMLNTKFKVVYEAQPSHS